MGLSTLASILWNIYHYELPDPPLKMAHYIIGKLEAAGYEIVEIKKEGAPITGTPIASQEPTSFS